MKFDKTEPFPVTVRQLRNVEKSVFNNATLRSCSFEDIDIPVVTQTGVPMILVTADLICVTYDLIRVAQDLLNDGDHGVHAQFQYEECVHPVSKVRQYGEMWTGEWWRRQHADLPDGSNILVPIIYVDETPVTHNGRNMHPVYMSLGNLYVDARYAKTNFTYYSTR